MTKSRPSKSTRANRRRRLADALNKRGLKLTRYDEDEGWVSFHDRRISEAALVRNERTYGNTPRMMVELIEDHEDCEDASGACLLWEFGHAYTFRGTDLDDPEVTVR